MRSRRSLWGTDIPEAKSSGTSIFLGVRESFRGLPVPRSSRCRDVFWLQPSRVVGNPFFVAGGLLLTRVNVAECEAQARAAST